MVKLKEMGNFLIHYHWSKLNQEQINNLNRPITPSEIEAVIKSLPMNKNPRHVGFITEFHQTFQEELTPIWLKLLHKVETEGTLLNLLPKATVTLTSKPHRVNKDRELQTNFPYEHGCKTAQ